MPALFLKEMQQEKFVVGETELFALESCSSHRYILRYLQSMDELRTAAVACAVELRVLVHRKEV